MPYTLNYTEAQIVTNALYNYAKDVREGVERAKAEGKSPAPVPPGIERLYAQLEADAARAVALAEKIEQEG